MVESCKLANKYCCDWSPLCENASNKSSLNFDHEC